MTSPRSRGRGRSGARGSSRCGGSRARSWRSPRRSGASSSARASPPSGSARSRTAWTRAGSPPSTPRSGGGCAAASASLRSPSSSTRAASRPRRASTCSSTPGPRPGGAAAWGRSASSATGRSGKALERRAVALGVRGATRFAGSTADVAPWLQAADVFVLPSRQEGLSVALLEAMATGVPAVATEVGGTREAVGGTAVLVPPADPRALAEALCALLDEPGRARELGEAARVRVLSRFGILNVARRHLELYREVGEGRPRAAVGEGRPRAAGGGHGGWASAGRVPRVVVPRDHGDVHPGRGP